MRHLSERGLLLALLILISTLAAQAGMGAGGDDLRLQALAMTPAARADLSQLEEIPRYTISLQLDLEGLSYSGTETLHYTNTGTTALEELYFRLYPNGDKTYGAGALHVSTVRVEHTTLQPVLELEGTALRVPLPEALAPGAEVVVTLEFEGQVPRDFASRSGESYGIFNYSQGVLTLANWYPLLAVRDEEGWRLERFYSWGDAVTSAVAFYDVTITAPDEVVVIASGSEICREPIAEGKTRHRFITGPVRDFVVSASARFQRRLVQVGETVINSYFFPEHAVGGGAALTVAQNALGLFNERYGLYPYAELDVVETPLPWPGGVEYPGVVLISDKLYYTPNPLGLDFAMIISHEVAHQWWYGVVGNDVIREPWLDEALATYSSGIYVQTFLGLGAYGQLRQSWEAAYHRARAANPAPITASVDQFTSNTDYYGIVYCGGALFYEALHAEIGDTAFFTGLQRYFQGFKYKLATTEDLLQAFQEAAGRDLSRFYAEWLYAPVGD